MFRIKQISLETNQLTKYQSLTFGEIIVIFDPKIYSVHIKIF